MTLKNARRRFEALDCEVDKAERPHKYRWRPIGQLAWRLGYDLEFMLKEAVAFRSKKP